MASISSPALNAATMARDLGTARRADLSMEADAVDASFNWRDPNLTARVQAANRAVVDRVPAARRAQAQAWRREHFIRTDSGLMLMQIQSSMRPWTISTETMRGSRI